MNKDTKIYLAHLINGKLSPEMPWLNLKVRIGLEQTCYKTVVQYNTLIK